MEKQLGFYVLYCNTLLNLRQMANKSNSRREEEEVVEQMRICLCGRDKGGHRQQSRSSEWLEEESKNCEAVDGLGPFYSAVSHLA